MGLKSEILNKKLTDDQIGIFYLGQVGFLLKYREKYILIDGYLSDYVDRNCCSELVHWVRRYPAPLTGDDLDFVDYVFCTHAHFDHADPDTLSAIARINKKAKFIVPQALLLSLWQASDSPALHSHEDVQDRPFYYFPLFLHVSENCV